MLDVSDGWDDSWPIPTSTNSITIDLNDHKTGPTSICRYLLKEGADPLTTIEFYRGATLCFTKPTTVGEWARLEVKESEDGKYLRFIALPPA